MAYKVKKFDKETRKYIAELLMGGYTYQEVCEEYGISHVTANRYRKEFENELSDVKHKGGKISSTIDFVEETESKIEEDKPFCVYVAERIIRIHGVATNAEYMLGKNVLSIQLNDGTISLSMDQARIFLEELKQVLEETW